MHTPSQSPLHLRKLRWGPLHLPPARQPCILVVARELSLSSDFLWLPPPLDPLDPATTATQLFQGPLLSFPLRLSWPPPSLELSEKGKSESGD